MPNFLDPVAIRQRIAELRQDDARMRPAPWDCLPLIVRLHSGDQPLGSESYGVARARNALASTADMLEGLVERLDAAHEAMRLLHAANKERSDLLDDIIRLNHQNHDLRTENARLTAEVDRLRDAVATTRGSAP